MTRPDTGPTTSHERPEEKPDALEERLLELTRRSLARRRRTRRFLLALLPVATFLLGYAVRGLEPEAEGMTRAPTEEAVEEAPPPAAEEPAPPGERVPPAEEVPSLPEGWDATDPLDLEVRARTIEGPERRALLKAAGDLWLRDRANVAAATRCYVAYLTQAEDEGPRPEDTWLLAHLRVGT